MRLLFRSVLMVLLLGAPAGGRADDAIARFAGFTPESTAVIDHGPWAHLLSRYLVRDPALALNRFAYARVKPEERALLDGYIDRLAAIAITAYSRDEQLAYWINLYNALTVRLILEHYPLDTIRDIDISPGWFAVGPWGAPLVTVEGVALSLDNIEHDILRAFWDEPLIHYGVNCASVGCPNLAPEPYRGVRVRAQLEAGARDFVNSPRGVLLEDGTLVVSSLYGWYEDDFGGSEKAVIAHLAAYAAAPLAAALSGFKKIGSTRYDWSLNDAPSQ